MLVMSEKQAMQAFEQAGSREGSPEWENLLSVQSLVVREEARTGRMVDCKRRLEADESWPSQAEMLERHRDMAEGFEANACGKVFAVLPEFQAEVDALYEGQM